MSRPAEWRKRNEYLELLASSINPEDIPRLVAYQAPEIELDLGSIRSVLSAMLQGKPPGEAVAHVYREWIREAYREAYRMGGGKPSGKHVLWFDLSLIYGLREVEEALGPRPEY